MKILIFQPMLKHYRVALYEKLAKRLQDEGHEVRLVFGSPPKTEQAKKDNVVLDKAYCFYPKSHWFIDNKLHYLKGASRHIFWADFVITEQANKHLFNYLLIILRALKCKKIAYWGHGMNRQGNQNSLRERTKKLLAVYSDWWFAYTQGVADYIVDLGYPANRITVINNAIDTRQFRDSLSILGDEEITAFRMKFNLSGQCKMGLYCGSLYKEKMVPFLLDAACEIHKQMPDFVLMVVGDGPEREIVEKYARNYPFIHYLGAAFDQDKVLAFSCADVFLCPGLVGLAILDAFAAGLPVFSTLIDIHSPEIEYLEEGVNGCMTGPDVGAYAAAIVTLFKSNSKLQAFKENALKSSMQFSLEDMVENIAQGIRAYEKSYE